MLKAFRRLTPDQITTLLGILAALKIYLTAKGLLDQTTAEFLSAVMVVAGGYYSNRKAD